MNSSNARHVRKKKPAGHAKGASSNTPTAPFIALIRNAAIGTGCALCLVLLFLLVATLITHHAADPDKLVGPLGLAALYLAAMAAGFLITRLQGGDPLLCGLVGGAMILLLCLVLGLCLPAPEASHAGNALLTRLPVPVISVLSAIPAGKRRTTVRHKKRR